MNRIRRVFQYIDLEARAFYYGTQGLPPEAVLARIGAWFEQVRHRTGRRFIDRIKRGEALVETLTRLRDEAANVWQGFKAEVNGRMPSMAAPFSLMLLAAVAAVGETAMLAPMMDAFDIADPTLQHGAALMLVVICGGLLKMSLALMKAPKQDRLGRFINWIERASVLGLTLFALSLAGVLGLWRVEAMIFGAAHRGSPLADFGNYGLSVLLGVGLTVGASVFVALAVGRGWEGFDYARQWRKARRAFFAFGRQLDSAEKELEAVEARRDSELAEIDERRREWEETYRENHGLGQLVGAVRQAGWLVGLKIAAFTLFIATGCMVFDLLFPDAEMPLRAYALVTLALGSLYAYRTLQARDRPSARQLYRQRRTIWRDAATAPVKMPAVLGYATILALIVVLLLLSACGPAGPAVELKVMPDLSGSVTEEGRLTSIEAIQAVFPMLRRGDSLTVIPITGDARTDVPGKILRLELPRDRTIYDRDLRELCQSLRPSLAEMARTQPYKFSDLLGTVAVTAQELTTDQNTRRALAMLSDFIHHTNDLNFKNDKRLANDGASRVFATELATGRESRFQGVQVYLGSVLTKDLKELGPKRRDAIQVFWLEFFTRQGAHARWVTDGPGQLPRFLKALGRAGKSADLQCGPEVDSTTPTTTEPDQDLGGSR